MSRLVKPRGVTLVELMVTLVIAATILSLGLITLRGYIPKHRLQASLSYMEGLLQRAQTEASARSFWTCVFLRSHPGSSPATAWYVVEARADKVGTIHGTGGCSATNTEITSVALKTGVEFGNSSNCTTKGNIDTGCSIWFDTTGIPKKCFGSGDCGESGTPASGCIDWNYQIVLSNPKLATDTRAREIEVMKGGLIQVVKNGTKGLEASLWAASSLSGLEATNGGCE